MSAAQKTTVLRAWIRFLKSGLRFDQFTKALYDHLIQHCSFIAHYNRAGFYSHYFEAGDSTAFFLSQFDSRGHCSSDLGTPRTCDEREWKEHHDRQPDNI